MQDSRPGTAKRRLPKWMVLSLLSAAIYGFPVFSPGIQSLGWESSAAVAQTVEDAEPEVLLEVEGSLEAGDPTLEDGSLFDEYTFSGRAGETVSITLESLEFDTYLLLLNENGERLAANDDIDPELIAITRNSWISLTLPVDGEYRVWVKSYREWERGQYRLTIVSGQTEPILSEVALRQSEAIRLLVQGDQQWRVSQFRESLESSQAALEIFREIGDRAGEGAALGNLGVAYDNLGQYQQAIDLYEQQLTITREIGDRAGEGAALGNLGIAYRNLGQYQQAIDLYEQRLTIAREIGDRAGEGAALGNLGLAYNNLGQYQQAIDLHEQRLTIAREISDRAGEGAALGNLGVAYNNLGQYQQAMGLYEQHLSIAREIGNRLGEGTALSNLGEVYRNLGQYQQAIDLYEQSLVITREIGDRAGEGSALNNLGIAYESLGQYWQAIDLFEQSLIITHEIADRALEGRALGNLGIAYFSLGQYQQAIDFYEQRLTIAREIGDRAGEGKALGNLGIAYFSLGQYQQAIDLYEQQLTITHEIGDRAGEGNALGNLGNAYNNLGQYQQAIDLHEQVLAIFREIGDRAGEGAALGNLGVAHNNLGEYQQAIDLYEQRLTIAREIGDRAGEGNALGNLGNAYNNLGQYQQAIDLYEQSLGVFQEIGAASSEGRFLANLGRTYNTQDNPELAIVFLKASVNVRETIRVGIQGLDSELQQSYTNTVADDYRLLANLLLSQGRIIEAQQVLELLKLEELREFSRSTRSGLESDEGVDLNPVEQDILAEFTTLVAFGKQVYECEQTRCPEFQTYRDQRRRQADRFNQRVTEFVQTIRDNRSDDEFFYDPSRLNETAQEIVAEPGTLLIYPFVTDDQLWLLYTAAGEVAGAVPVPVTQLELGNAVVQFRELLESPHSNLDDLQATGQKLYDWMIAPLSDEIAKNQIDTLVFAQDRVTRYIPMGALWDGSQYLAQRFTLSSILSAELTDMEDRLSPSPSDTSILALGLTAEIPPDFDALPNVETELDAIVNEGDGDALGIYPGLKFLNERFSFDTLFTHVLDHRILHIATHGKFIAGTPDASFLMLGDNTPLSIQQIESLGTDLDDVHLVVLSACETAVGGPDADGIEVAGISSYFLAANRASAVMASLWLVNDCSTSLLMQHFYKNLAQGMSKANALRQAQLTLLQSEASVEGCENRMFEVAPTGDAATSRQTAATDYSHPYYWAPFILIGNGL